MWLPIVHEGNSEIWRKDFQWTRYRQCLDEQFLDSIHPLSKVLSSGRKDKHTHATTGKPKSARRVMQQAAISRTGNERCRARWSKRDQKNISILSVTALLLPPRGLCTHLGGTFFKFKLGVEQQTILSSSTTLSFLFLSVLPRRRLLKLATVKKHHEQSEASRSEQT